MPTTPTDHAADAGPPAWAVGVIAIVVALTCFPRDAWAWTPGTHVFLGDALLRHLALLPTAMAELLAAYPADFLYGSIAADTSIAKKYAEVGRHCHSWRVGLEILMKVLPNIFNVYGILDTEEQRDVLRARNLVPLSDKRVTFLIPDEDQSPKWTKKSRPRLHSPELIRSSTAPGSPA